MFYVLD